MALTQRLEIRQSQSLVMTPQLMQAIKLLQLSNLDLAAYVDGELERNPLLERVVEGEPSNGGARRRRARAGAARRGIAKPGDWLGQDLEVEPQRHRGPARHPPRQCLPGRRRSRRPPCGRRGAGTAFRLVARGRRPRRDDGDYNLEAFVSAETTLADHLAEQLALAVADPAAPHDRAISHRSRRRGRLSRPATCPRLPTSSAPRSPRSKACWTVLQSFDPPGVCARNLTECLAIQLKERDRYDPAMQALVDHLDLLARRDFAALQAHLRRRRGGPRRDDRGDQAPQSQARPRLRLDPRAADRAGRVRAAGAGRRLARRAQFRHAAESAGQPELLRARSRRPAPIRARSPISPNACRRRPGSPRALDQRARTILKVATRDRAPAGRLLRPRRPAPAAAQPQARRRRHRHARIDGLARDRQQIHGDQPRHLRAEIFLHLGDRGGGRRRGAFGRGGAPPHQAADRRRGAAATSLSDDTIVDKLREAGIDIARRTVAKYREAMRIPSSVQRRREKLAGNGVDRERAAP